MQKTSQLLENSSPNGSQNGLKAPRVLLAETYRWPSTALFALDLAKAGYDVSFVCPTHHPVQKTCAVRQMFPYSGLRPLESLKTAIEATNPNFIIPCEERAVGHVHELHARAHLMGDSGRDLAVLIEKSLGPSASYPIVSSRYELLRMANEDGLRVPDTLKINSESDLKSWQARHEFPWVLKADGTYGGKGVKIVNTLNEAENFLAELTHFNGFGRAIKRLCVNQDAFWFSPWWNGVKPAMVAQSYIHGRAANCAVVCWRGKVLAGVGVDVLSAAGTTGPAAVIKITDNPDMMRCAERIAAKLNLSGFFGLDFMIENETGITWLIEMNPRLTRLSRLQLGKNRDQIGALYAQLSGQPARNIPPVTENKMIAYFPDAWDLKSELLESSYHDIPENEPALLEELRRPWPMNTLRWRLGDKVQRTKMFLQKPGFKFCGVAAAKVHLNKAKL